MAVTVQYEKDGTVNEWLLDIVEVARRHSGVALAVEFTKILDDFGVVDKVLSVTCDNATNNNVMILEMELNDALKRFNGQSSRVRCFAHVVNLVAKSIISQFDLPKKKTHQARLYGEEEDKDGNGDFMGLDMDVSLTGGDKRLQLVLKEVYEMAGNLNSDMRVEVEEVPPEEHEVDGVDGWVDKQWSMSEEELRELTENVMPAWQMMTKVGVCWSTFDYVLALGA
ncbi:hypothetical protein C0992_007896 [Termitomyces sp. T32_za158]|nr:hypothetical protein C0992_007896 [Termitomyces sp. T32_za158]